jgi:hypothetical protein
MRHRLSRGGNRRINMTLHIAAIVQLRHDTEGRAYYRRKLAAGKTPMEATRCLIGGVSGPRLGWVPGRGSSVVSGDGLAAAPRGRPV